MLSKMEMRRLTKISQLIYKISVIVILVGAVVLQGASGHNLEIEFDDALIFTVLSLSGILLHFFNKIKSLEHKRAVGVFLILLLVGVLAMILYFIKFIFSFNFNSGGWFMYLLSFTFLVINFLTILYVIKNIRHHT